MCVCVTSMWAHNFFCIFCVSCAHIKVTNTTIDFLPCDGFLVQAYEMHRKPLVWSLLRSLHTTCGVSWHNPQPTFDPLHVEEGPPYWQPLWCVQGFHGVHYIWREEWSECLKHAKIAHISLEHHLSPSLYESMRGKKLCIDTYDSQIHDILPPYEQ